MKRLFALVSFVAALLGCECESSTAASDASLRGPDSGRASAVDAASTSVSDSSAPRDTGPRPDAWIAPPPDIHVRLTADNAYGFGYGSGIGLANYFLGREDGSGQIFDCSASCSATTPCSTGVCDTFGTCNDDRLGAETYIVPSAAAAAGSYLYVVAWSDESVTQGVLGRFETADGTGEVIQTGDDGWEICATGMNYDIGSGGPTVEVINAQITACNAGTTPSGGWLGTTPDQNRALVMGEANEAGSAGDFRAVCVDPTRGDSVPTEAKWMWYDDDVTDSRSAFISDGDPHDEFLIFRLGTEVILY